MLLISTPQQFFISLFDIQACQVTRIERAILSAAHLTPLPAQNHTSPAEKGQSVLIVEYMLHVEISWRR